MYKDKKVIHLVARGKNGEIGANNELLWDIPEDMKFFRDSTLGHVCLAGRKTVESFPSPLRRRVTLCISSLKDCVLENCSFKPVSLDVALSCAYWQSNQLKTDKIFIIGGQTLYESTFDIADELWITEVDESYKHADRFYNIPDEFKMFENSDWMSSDCVDYRFTKWLKVEDFPF